MFVLTDNNAGQRLEEGTLSCNGRKQRGNTKNTLFVIPLISTTLNKILEPSSSINVALKAHLHNEKNG